jgi:hypothetical protein
MTQAVKLIGAVLVTISLSGSGVGITAILRNPSIAKQLFVYAILGLMLGFLNLFGF